MKHFLKTFIKFIHNYLPATIILLTIYACAGLSSIYNYDYPLTKQAVNSKTTGLKLNLPAGWRLVDANDSEFIDLWLVDDSDEASINLLPVSGIIKTNAREKDSARKVKEYYLSFVKANSPNFILVREETFEVGPDKFLAIEYNSNGILKRDVIFQKGEKFFVLSAFSVTNKNSEQIFSVQNSILKSISLSNGSNKK